MSNFTCETCGIHQIDSSSGYISGCAHYPPHHSEFVDVFFGGEHLPTRAFYAGAWYKSVRSQKQGLAIHPVSWSGGQECYHKQNRES